MQEARSASVLNHPYIVTIYSIHLDSSPQYIAMEYVEGRTLGDLIPAGRMALGDLLKLAVPIAEAVAAAHAALIVHRDLKPDNIMVTHAEQVKVLDFGLAKPIADISVRSDDMATLTAVTEAGMILGSAPYMSPEQAQGLAVDARSDSFSFGSVLHEMVTGSRAFSGKTPMETMSSIIKDEPAVVDGELGKRSLAQHETLPKAEG